MNTINIQLDNIFKATSKSKIPTIEALTRLLETHGALYKAYLYNNLENITEETIDNLISLISIACTIEKITLNSIEDNANKGFIFGVNEVNTILKSNRTKLLNEYSVNIGIISNFVQEYEKNKEQSSRDNVMDSINNAIYGLMYFLAYVSRDTISINNVINEKISISLTE